MNPGADVTSLPVLHDWYAAVAEFRTEAQTALTALDLSLRRSRDWMDEQQQHWRRQIRVCEEEVVQAKTELSNRRYKDRDGHTPDCTVQEENLRLAKARLEFAEDRLEAVRRWQKRLPMEIHDIYDGPIRHLTFFLDADLERGLALLARQLTALEQYANLRPEGPSAAASATEKEKS
jgi:hypothetical protein